MKAPLERAARALCSLDGHPEDATMDGKPLWQDYLPEARAVLAAIREPSEGILQAMKRTVPCDGHEWEFADWCAVEHWQAMIDAALAERP